MITPVAYIISRINTRLHSREIGAVYALARTLSKEEAEELCDYLIEQDDTSYQEDDRYNHVHRTLLEILQEQHQLTQLYPRYRPIGWVIAAARMERTNNQLLEELQKRFNMQSFEDQRAILQLFLARHEAQDCYRRYAYNYLERDWDATCAPDIQRCWLTYRDCASLVIRHLPESFVLEHAEELGQGDRYKQLCLRLCNNPAFCIDKNRLADQWDYLEIMQHKGEAVDGELLLSEFFTALRKEFSDIESCVSKMVDTANNIVGEEGYYASLKLLPSVQEYMGGLSRLGLQELLLRLLLWDQALREEHVALLNLEYDDTGEVLPSRAYYRLFCQIVSARLHGRSLSVKLGNPHWLP